MPLFASALFVSAVVASAPFAAAVVASAPFASVAVAAAPFAVRFRVRGSMLLRLRDASERRFEGRAAKYMHSATSLFAE